MIFYCIGIDYKKTPLILREQAYRRRDEIIRFFKERNSQTEVLFTCNRIEAYGLVCEGAAVSRLWQELKENFGDIFKNSYLRCGLLAVARHALRLSAGLHSQILGESQIFSQLVNWSGQEGFPEILGRFWSEVLAKAKDIIRQLPAGARQTDIAEVVLADIAKKLRFKSSKEIIIVGTGKVAQLFARQPAEDRHIYFVARKKQSRAKQLAALVGGDILSITDLPQLLPRVDVLISATSSPHCLIKGVSLLSGAGRRQNPLYIYDLAVPRDIAEEVGRIEGVVLHDLESINEIIAPYNRAVGPYYKKAELLIEEAVADIQGAVNENAHKGWNAAFTAGVVAGRRN